ncbi:hypothetical protein HS088_TW01G00861 [Tripterygium wilfordii]|uniref:Transmembrane protein n=2 Tax=Tripterygium wilfordii TaxID=458696 RepID=A0A7J7E336_TRIWF|nr:hypothetical protein HS088_TW01G00861 [Tripterygium wilfordii]
MASLFAYSASVQFNDPDWYFWLPLYACAFFVNLVNWVFLFNSTIRQIAKLALWLGLFLFVKVVIEGFVSGAAGFWSLDLSERVVREKIGSGLVVTSMILHLEASSSEAKLRPRYIEHGMTILVGISYGLPFAFFVVHKGEMK